MECGSWKGLCSPTPSLCKPEITGEKGPDLPKVMKGKLPRVSNRFNPGVHQLGPVVLGNT